MLITEFTSFDQVRAALGVKDLEISDETLSLQVYSDHLQEEFYAISSSLLDKHTQINGIPEASRTNLQSRFLRLVNLFSTYAVAKQAGVGLPMFSPRSIGDGKASMSRFSLDPYKETLKRMEEQYNLNRERLTKVVGELDSLESTRTVRTYLTAVSPAYDPVTGEGG